MSVISLSFYTRTKEGSSLKHKATPVFMLCLIHLRRLKLKKKKNMAWKVMSGAGGVNSWSLKSLRFMLTVFNVVFHLHNYKVEVSQACV